MFTGNGVVTKKESGRLLATRLFRDILTVNVNARYAMTLVRERSCIRSTAKLMKCGASIAITVRQSRKPFPKERVDSFVLVSDFRQRFEDVFGDEYLASRAGMRHLDVCEANLAEGYSVVMSRINGSPCFMFLEPNQDLMVAMRWMTEQNKINDNHINRLEWKSDGVKSRFA